MFLQSFKTGSNSAAGRVTDFFSRTFRRDSSLTRDEKAFTGAGLGIQEEGPFVPTVINLPLLDQARRTRPLARIADAEDKTQIWMPALAWRCIQYLNERAVKEEGLYRISGSQVKVVGYQRRFDRGELPQLDVHQVCIKNHEWLTVRFNRIGHQSPGRLDSIRSQHHQYLVQGLATRTA